MKKTILLTAAVLSIGSLATGQVLQDWQFNDDANTSLDTVVNSVSGGGTWNFGGFKTTGNGDLLIGDAPGDNAYDQDYADAVSTYRKLAPSLTALTSGILSLEVSVSGWDLDGLNDGGVGNRGVSFALWDEPNNEKVFLQFETSGTDIRVQSTAPGANTNVTGSTVSDGLGAYDMNGGGAVTFQLNIDLDSGAWSSRVQTAADPGNWTDLTTDGVGFTQVTNVQIIRGTFDGPSQSISSWEAGEYVLVDSITLTQVPEPATYALYGGVVALGLVIYRRRRQHA